MSAEQRNIDFLYSNQRQSRTTIIIVSCYARFVRSVRSRCNVMICVKTARCCLEECKCKQNMENKYRFSKQSSDVMKKRIHKFTTTRNNNNNRKMPFTIFLLLFSIFSGSFHVFHVKREKKRASVPKKLTK